MKELSFLVLLKNSLGGKMRKGCNGDGSTSTLNQHPLQVEDMIMNLDMNKESRRRSRRRSSCMLNNTNTCSDNILLMSARDALSQYPRFSLDGKDAMYRSSFRNTHSPTLEEGRRSVCCDQGTLHMRRNRHHTDNLVWCKPGVVAKLMGLEAMPSRTRTTTTTTTTSHHHTITNNKKPLR